MLSRMFHVLIISCTCYCEGFRWKTVKFWSGNRSKKYFTSYFSYHFNFIQQCHDLTSFCSCILFKKNCNCHETRRIARKFKNDTANYRAFRFHKKCKKIKVEKKWTRKVHFPKWKKRTKKRTKKDERIKTKAGHAPSFCKYRSFFHPAVNSLAEIWVA